MSAEMLMAWVSLALSLGTFGLVLSLLYREKRDYAMRSDFDKLGDHVTNELARLQHSQSQLYRYVEAVDAQAGGNGHQVLRRQVRRGDSEA